MQTPGNFLRYDREGGCMAQRPDMCASCTPSQRGRLRHEPPGLQCATDVTIRVHAIGVRSGSNSCNHGLRHGSCRKYTLALKGRGGNDAAYATAVEIEYCRMHGIDYTGGAADICKCFDHVRREIVYKLMEETGIPRGVLHAYQDFQERVMVRDTIAGGFGEAYSKPTSIPQGDPCR